MKELQQIIEAFDHLCAEGKPAALATVVSVEGSAYRKPGARMLIAEDGRMWGGVSGGCLERDVARRGRAVIASGAAVVCRYDTADEMEDGHAAVALGCRGIIDIFIEPLSGDSPGPLSLIRKVIQDRRPAVQATIVRCEGLPNIKPGVRMSADAIAASVSSVERELIEAINGATSAMDARCAGPAAADIEARETHSRMHDSGEPTSMRRVRVSCGEADVFVEWLRPPQSLVIFGNGTDVVPLVEIAKVLGWHVTVVSMRPATGLAERFAGADALHVGTPEDPMAGIALEPEAAVVLLTHNYSRDARILSTLIHQPLRYIGVLGPRYRAKRLLADLPPRTPSDHLFAPIGLDLGADTPQAIALAIIAEIQAVLHCGEAGFLRDRSAPLHVRFVTAELSQP